MKLHDVLEQSKALNVAFWRTTTPQCRWRFHAALGEPRVCDAQRRFIMRSWFSLADILADDWTLEDNPQ